MKSVTPISASAASSLSSAFERRYTTRPSVYSAPGRVNLIGEHTDYNDGFVLPMAIQQRTLVAAAARADRCVRVYSADLDEEVRFDLNQPYVNGARHWSQYVEGVARTLVSGGVALPGADLMITSEVPLGAGLSSSAALELATALALIELANGKLSAQELARIGQTAEHEFVGVKCGIMDQLVSAMAQQGHALLIDCRSLMTRQVALPRGEFSLLLCDTGVRHSHTDSGYNERRSECEQAAKIIAHEHPIQNLRDVSETQLDEISGLLPAPLFKRVRHVVSENQRTLDAASALEHGELELLGRLMHASHASLRDDFEVSCGELDHVVEVASTHPSVLGARMTGGGFGGAVIVLVQGSELVGVSELVAASYKLRFGQIPELRIITSGEGMRAEAV